MISQQFALGKARSIASKNQCVWREEDIHIEQVAARPPSDSWWRRKVFDKARGFPMCWMVRMGAKPTTTDWQTEELGGPIGEGYGYLIDIETGEFIGIDIGYDVVRKNFTHLKG